MTETGAPAHQPTPASIRARIAEVRIRQHRIAARLDISDGHLSNILAGRAQASGAFLAQIAAAVEAVAADAEVAITVDPAEATA